MGADRRRIPSSKRRFLAADDRASARRRRQAAQARRGRRQPAPDRARIDKGADGASQLVVDDPFDRAWRRVGLALDRIGFTVVDRDRSKGLYFVRYADPDLDKKKRRMAGRYLDQAAVLEDDDTDKPEQYRVVVDAGRPAQRGHRAGPERRARHAPPTSEKILALLKDQLK